jgi:hypothetical protein
LKATKHIQVNIKKRKNIMKKFITLSALLLALGTSVFAAVPATIKASDEVSFFSLPADRGFAIKVNKQEAGKSIVIIYNKDNAVIFKDVLSKAASAEKGYVVSNLENGDYTVEVVSAKKTVTKQLHVYDEGQKKSYIFINE